jgi:multicomponent Na+:H+ antiporter subunit B
VLGLRGLIYGRSFLYNFLPLGTANAVFSAGVIPLIYVAIGLKVGSELTGILDNLMETIR